MRLGYESGVDDADEFRIPMRGYEALKQLDRYGCVVVPNPHEGL